MPATTPDFTIRLTAGQLMPTGAVRKLTIESTGACTGDLQPHRNDTRHIVRNYYLGNEGIGIVEALLESTAAWTAETRNPGYVDGDYVRVELRLGKRAHEVTLVNAPDPAVEHFVAQINELVPDELQIHYNALDVPGLGEAMP